MSTSLAAQLKKLAVPQTSLLQERKKKPSLLFDPQEAAKFDRDTFYEIGISGLDELRKLNPKFEEFHKSLFDLSSRSLERSVEDKKTNKELDKLIRRFLLLLSPYFLIKSAHKTLEWLVNRFHIESFNVDDLMSLIFPYHHTRIFVRVLQMIDVSDPTNKWHWLHPLQAPGVPLSKTALLNRCAVDSSFLLFVIKTTSDAVKVYEGQGSALSTLMAFHCTSVIGGLEYANEITEVQVTLVLRSLLEGLKSPVVDYCAASYMIIAQLVRQTKLNDSFFYSVLGNVAKCPHESLRSECALVLVHLYQTHRFDGTPHMPAKALQRLLHLNWLPSALRQLQDAGVHIHSFFLSFLQEILLNIQSESSERENKCNFAEQLVHNVLDARSATQAMCVIVENFDIVGLMAKKVKKEHKSDKKMEVVEKQAGKVDKVHEIIKWYCGFFQSLERKYPEIYDKVVKRYLNKDNATSEHGKAIRILLGVAKGAPSQFPGGEIDVFEKLHHPVAAYRADAVRYLVANYTSLGIHNKDLISSTLSARLQDDSPKVIKETLHFPTKLWVKLLGAETVLEGLLKLSSQCLKNTDNEEWCDVGNLLVEHICSDYLGVHSKLDETRIILALLPFFFPETKGNISIMRHIMEQKSFINRCKLLCMLSKELAPKQLSVSALDTCSVFIMYLSERQTSLDMETLVECGEKIASENGKAIHIFFLLLTLGSSFTNEMNPTLSSKILDTFLPYIERYKMITVPGDLMQQEGKVMLECVKKSKQGFIPLSGFLYCILQLVHYTPLPSTLKSEERKWWDLYFTGDDENQASLRCTIRMLEVLMTGCGSESEMMRMCYGDALKEFFKVHFPNLVSQIRFLCNVCACPGVKGDGICWPALRLRCLHLLQHIIIINKTPLSWAVNLDEPIIPALVVAISSQITSIRHLSLLCLLKFGSLFGANLKKDSTFSLLIRRIEERQDEVKLDAEQLPIIMYTTLSPDKAVRTLSSHSERSQLPAILDSLLKCIMLKDTPLYIKMELLKILVSANSEDILVKLTPLGQDALSSGKDSGDCLDENWSGILCNIIERLTRDTAACLNKPQCWDFIHSALMDWKTKVLITTGGRTCPSVLVMQQVTREMFETLDEAQQQKLLISLVKAASDSELPEVGSTAGRAIKTIALHCKLIAVELEQMKNAQISAKEKETLPKRNIRSKGKANPPSPAILESKEWRYGITLLEWVQSKKKLQSTDVLLLPLFSILDKCLQFEEQAPVEYSKQLVLSCILHCCQKLSTDNVPIEKSVLQAFNVEAIVQCIRASQNPQTHHHALLLLAHVAGILPEQVLHNIMAIFTFMGSSILRQDDGYSFQVISKIVDTIIPILVKASKGMVDRSVEVDGAICSVMRVFADTVLHVPLHRRLLLYQKLLTTLGPDQSLWMFVCLVLEGHVLHGQEDQPQDARRERGEMSQRQEFLLNLMQCFPSSTIIVTCIMLVRYIQSLQSKDQSDKVHQKSSSGLALSLVPGLFNEEMHTPKQLRHYKFSISTFLSTLLSSPQVVKQVAELSDEDIHDLEPLYQELIENLLIHIKTVSRHYLQSMQKNKTEQAIKYWSVMLNLTFDILDKVNALLPSTMFLVVIRSLLSHKLPTVRRKAMELLNMRLQHQTAIFSICSREAFYNILEPLVGVMGSIGKESTEIDIETTQQVAMLSIKLLARQLAPEDPRHFKQILEHVTALVRSKAVQKNLLASVVLCLAELVSVLRVHAVEQLNKFMPSIIKILKDQKDAESPSLLLLSVITATQKIVDVLSHFLGPYLGKVLLEVSIQSAKWQHHSDDSKVSPINHKLKAIRQKISSSIPPRVLIPAIGSCYSQLLEERQYAALGPLLSILADSFSSVAGSELPQLMPDLTAFFLLALQCRSDSDNSVSQEDISEAESHVVNALVALVLKLSEPTFKPLYYSLFHWATSSEEHKDRLITFYRLSSSIAEALKGLFVLFAGRLVSNAAKLLDCVNVSRMQEVGSELIYGEEEKAQLLLQYILKTLHQMFLHDGGQGFINNQRSNELMLPIVNQLENTLGGVEALQSRVSSLLSPCITQFAIAVADDVMWKQLNYQVLIKTRHNLPQVRLAALEVLCELARKLGEDYLHLLPETVPFLAELFEDEEEVVETACQKAVQDLEEILGEPIKKYF